MSDLIGKESPAFSSRNPESPTPRDPLSDRLHFVSDLNKSIARNDSIDET